jgi:hypothetical protein
VPAIHPLTKGHQLFLADKNCRASEIQPVARPRNMFIIYFCAGDIDQPFEIERT